MKKDGRQEGTEVQYKEFKSEFTDFSDEEVTFSFRFRKPRPAELDRSNKESQKNPARAFKNLCLTLIDPEQKDNFNEAVKEYPGLSMSFANEIYERMGFGSLGK
ncbi:MAG: hypothetical protein OEV42_14740 [Deltaproteobacteria bacterium]|nr:hypothetical protein [Deltaproteobacteria bacterium]